MSRNKARIHITINTVRALRASPPNKKDFIWDDEVRGFGAYRTSHGAVVFVYQYRMPHQPARRAKIGEFGDLTPAQARDLAREWAVQRRQGRDPIDERRAAARERKSARDLTLSAYVDAYLRRREIEGRPMNRQHRRIMIEDVAGLMPNVRIDRMGSAEIDAWQEALLMRSKSARLYGLVYLKAVLNDAKDKGVITKSPADAYKLPPRVERERVLGVIELLRVLESLADMGGYHADAIECLLRTMRRKEEVAAMSWEEIDQETWRWTLPSQRTKTAARYAMDLPPQVVDILVRRQPDPAKRTGWVFSHTGERSVTLGSQDKDRLDAHMHRRIELAAAKGGPVQRVEQWSLHDFRTTGGTHMGEAYLDIPGDVIELCLAHAARKRGRSKYQRSEKRDAVRDAFAAWNDFLDGLLRRPDAWPGGRNLDPIPKGELLRRKLALRQGWPRKVRPTGKSDEGTGGGTT